MKKLVSLLLAVMMLASMMTFSVSASTDTLVISQNPENEIAAGQLSPDRSSRSNCYMATNWMGTGSDVNVIKDGDNSIFEINGQGSGSTGCSLYYLATSKGFSHSQVTRFTALVKLPSVETGITNLFVPNNNWSATTSSLTFGVRLEDATAKYFDPTLGEEGEWVPFLDEPMEADKWYRVEAIMDSREAKLDGNKTYMNAYIYDAETNDFLGTSDWKNVINVKPTSDYYAWLASTINARGYGADSVVCIDEFNIYTISDLPEYTISDADAVSTTTTNRYMTSGNGTQYYRAIGDNFNKSGDALVTASTPNKAVRVEMDFRIPVMDSASRYDFLAFEGHNYMPYYKAVDALPDVTANKGSGQATLGATATVQVTSSGLTVNSFNATTGKYDTAVALTNGNSLTITSNTWYKLVWDVDYSGATPTGMLYIKDANGNSLAQTTAPYTVQPIAVDAWSRNYNAVMYAGTMNVGDTFDIDNTNIYIAADAASLATDAARTTVISEDFESFADGTTYGEVSASATHRGTPGRAITTASVASNSVTVSTGFSFADGMVFEDTTPFGLKFAYTSDVPVSNITKNNIEFYADDDVKLESGYTITTGTANANNCVKEFIIRFNELQWNTDYKLRLKSELADYNTSGSYGVSATTGLYEDITFSVASLIPDCKAIGEIIEGDGTATAKVIFTNNEESPITCYAILGVYNGQKLVDIEKSELITIAAGAENYEATVDAVTVPAGATVKLFVWNNFETMRPWIIPVVLGE